MRYIIMADGEGSRWNNYQNVPKHLIKVGSENLLERTVRLIRKIAGESDIVITSKDLRYSITDAIQYSPKNNVLEIDRFTYELVEDNVCFLYGDVFYTEEGMKEIIHRKADELLFFGDRRSIIAIKVINSNCFKEHVMNVRERYLKGDISQCIGWQLYQSYIGQPFGEKLIITDKFQLMEYVFNINEPRDFEKLLQEIKLWEEC